MAPFNDVTSYLDPIMFMGLSGGATPTAQNLNQYADNVVRRGAIYGSMRDPRPYAGRTAAPRGVLAPMPGAGVTPPFMAPGSIGAANDALQSVDPQLSEPTHINPFLFFADQHPDGSLTWAGNHPGAARALEGAMIGFTTPPGNSLGEDITNVARTVLGIPGMYRANAQAQMEAPFGIAGQILGVQKAKAQIDAENATAAANNAHAAYYKTLPDTRDAAAAERAKPFITPGGNAFTWDGKAYVRAPQFDEAPRGGRMPGTVHYTEQDYIDHLNDERKAAGQPPLDAKGELQAVHEYYGSNGKGRPIPPRIDPNLRLQIDQTNKDFDQWSKILDENKPRSMQETPELMQQFDPDRYKRYTEATQKLADIKQRRDNLLEQHYKYSQSTQAGDDSDNDGGTSGPYNGPLPIAPVRTAPTLPPGTTNVVTNDGQPGQIINTPQGPRMVPAQPGTTTIPTNPFRRTKPSPSR